MPYIYIAKVLYTQVNDMFGICEFVIILFYTVNTSSISANLNNIPMLNGTNFRKRKEHITNVIGCMDLDYTIWSEKPPVPTESNTVEQRALYKK